MRVELFLTAVTIEAARADHGTGGGIAVVHDALAHLLGLIAADSQVRLWWPRV